MHYGIVQRKLNGFDFFYPLQHLLQLKTVEAIETLFLLQRTDGDILVHSVVVNTYFTIKRNTLKSHYK